MKRFAVIALVALSLLAPAHAVRAADKVPLANYGGGAFPIKAGDTLQARAPTTANASINLPHGTAPTSPADGDCWTTTAGMFCRINSATVGPLVGAGGAGTPGGSSGQIQYNNAGAFGGAAVSGDCTATILAFTCTKTSGTSFATSATTDTTNASNISSGSLALARLAAISADNLLMNATGSSAAPTGAAVPACADTSGQHLNFASHAFSCGTSGGSSLPSIAPGHVVGNGTGSTATAADSTLTSIFDQAFSGASQGDILYRGATTWSRLGAGLSGQVLQTNGGSANPSWATPAGGTVGATAMVKIAETVTSGSQASVTFSSIPGTYRDLMLVVTARSTQASLTINLKLQFNGDTGANYTQQYINAIGGGAGASAAVAQTAALLADIPGSSATANVSGSSSSTIYAYAGSTFQKEIVSGSGARWGTSNTTMEALFMTNYWTSTAAITSMLVFPAVGNFFDGSIVTLYGVGG